jgi:hypothetical protein
MIDFQSQVDSPALSAKKGKQIIACLFLLLTAQDLVQLVGKRAIQQRILPTAVARPLLII